MLFLIIRNKYIVFIGKKCLWYHGLDISNSIDFWKLVIHDTTMNIWYFLLSLVHEQIDAKIESFLSMQKNANYICNKCLSFFIYLLLFFFPFFLLLEQVVSPFPPSDKIGINSVQREAEEIVPMKQMKMDWVPYIPLENRYGDRLSLHPSVIL